MYDSSIGMCRKVYCFDVAFFCVCDIPGRTEAMELRLCNRRAEEEGESTDVPSMGGVHMSLVLRKM